MMGGLWGGIANLGLAGRGFEAEDAVIAENKRRESAQKLTDIAVKEAMRREGLEQGLRDAVSKVPMRAAASGLPMTTVTPPDESDRWGETQIATTPGMDLPASVDARGKAEAGARYLADQGELERAEKYRQAAKAMEDEGYKTVVVGVAAGKDPKAIAEEFNQVGKHRIVNAAANGGTYRFQLDDGTEMPVTQAGARNLATAMGYLKKPETKIVPQGATETVDGVPVYHNDPKPDHEKIDPLSPKGIAARKDFEEYKASMLGGEGRGKWHRSARQDPRGAAVDVGLRPEPGRCDLARLRDREELEKLRGAGPEVDHDVEGRHGPRAGQREAHRASAPAGQDIRRRGGQVAHAPLGASNLEGCRGARAGCGDRRALDAGRARIAAQRHARA
jgi:hypothetical protein